MVIKDGKVVINAVHDRDAEWLWKKLKLKDTEPCFVCGTNVTYKTMGAVAKHKGKVVVICEKLSCFYEFEHKRKE